jgi:hypothetical protein
MESLPTDSPPLVPPPFLEGIVSAGLYNDWAYGRARQLLKRDKRRKKPYAKDADWRLYREKIHGAVLSGGLSDPYSGDALRWDLIKTWDPRKSKDDPDFFRHFYLLPTVDHIDPESAVLEFEMCSWIVNCVKGYLAPAEFLALCDKIATYTQEHPISSQPIQSSEAPVKPSFLHRLYFSFLLPAYRFFPGLASYTWYPLPAFLEGICKLSVYRTWILRRAISLYHRDRKMKRPCAQFNTITNYRHAIHAAVIKNGLKEPYTGDVMKWELIGTWDSTKGSDNEERYKTEYRLLPTVDHLDPQSKVIQFEICSWEINACKNNLNPGEFVALCGKIRDYRQRNC